MPSAIHLWTWDARPFPVFPAADRRLERRRQLGDRPLAHRPARRRRRSTRWSPRSCRCRRRPGSTPARSARGGRLCGRPADVAARRDRAAGAGLCLRCRRRTAKCCVFSQRGGAPVIELDRGRSGAARGQQRTGATDAYAGDASCRAKSRSRFTDAATDYRRRRRRARAVWSARAAQRHADLAIVTNDSGSRGAPKSGCRICGPAAKAPSSRCRRAGLRLALATLRA